MALGKSKRLSKIVILITFIILSWLIFEVIIKGFGVVTKEYGIDPKLFLAVLVICEIFFNLGIVLMILGSGVLKLRLKHVLNLDFQNVVFENELVYTGFTINRIAAFVPPAYLLLSGWGRLPGLIEFLLVVEIGIVLAIALIPFELDRILNMTKLRNATLNDVNEIEKVEQKVWGNEAAGIDMIASRIETFPEGTIVAVKSGKIIGVVFTQLINGKNSGAKTWYEYTDNGLLKNTHDPKGDTLFGVDLSVLPEHSGKGVGTNLLIAVGELGVRLGLKKGMLGGRIPLYKDYDHMDVNDYIKAKDDNGRIIDPEIRFYKRAGLTIKGVVPNYFKDPDSKDYGVLLEWQNPFYFVRNYRFLRPIAAKIFKIGFKINLMISK